MAHDSFAALECITVETRGATRLVTINRPTKANALTRQTMVELQALIQATSENEKIRLFVLTGAGDRVFCAGADLGEAKGETTGAASAQAYDAHWDALTGSIASLPCVTLAVLNGACIGGGMSVALAFDMRFASAHAYFSYPAARHGFMPSPQDVQRLVQSGGRSATTRILLAGEKFPAADAAICGLVDRILEGDLWSELVRLEEGLASSNPVSILASKRLIQSGTPSVQLQDLCYRAVYDRDAVAIQALRSGQ